MKRTTLVFLLFLVGCTSTPPERNFYLLRADVSDNLAAAPPESSARLGQIGIAPYLDRAGIVIEVGEHQVREARYHLWAEPLDRGIRSYLSDRIASRLGHALETRPGAARYRIDVDIEEFHGTADGEARLVARWSVHDRSVPDGKDDSLLTSRRVVRTRRQTGDGYANLVSTLIALLDTLADDVAQGLTDIGA